MLNNLNFGTCALCKEKKDLMLSHIIPKFFNKVIKEDSKYMIFIENKNPKKVQDGIKEHLLCLKCEQILSIYENYFSKIFRNGFIINENNDLYSIVQVDYSNFKLFYLSLIWRFAASENRFINLDRHKDIIGNLLLNKNPGSELDYPIAISEIEDDNNSFGGDEKLKKQFYDYPTYSKIEGHHIYSFILAGYSWNIFVSSHINQCFFKDYFSLKKDGKLFLYRNICTTSLLVNKRYLPQLLANINKK